MPTLENIKLQRKTSIWQKHILSLNLVLVTLYQLNHKAFTQTNAK